MMRNREGRVGITPLTVLLPWEATWSCPQSSPLSSPSGVHSGQLPVFPEEECYLHPSTALSRGSQPSTLHYSKEETSTAIPQPTKRDERAGKEGGKSKGCSLETEAQMRGCRQCTFTKHLLCARQALCSDLYLVLSVPLRSKENVPPSR